jgi:hypothetical protein
MKYGVSILVAFLLLTFAVGLSSHPAEALMWNVQNTSINANGGISLALSPDGTPHMMFGYGYTLSGPVDQHAEVDYATRSDNGTWQSQLVKDQGWAYSPVYFGVDAPYLNVRSDGVLTCADAVEPGTANNQTPFMGELVNGTWTITTLTPRYFASTIDSNDIRTLTRVSGTALVYEYYEGGLWHSTNIPGASPRSSSTSPTYRLLSIDMDSYDRPHITYYSSLNTLRYAWYDGQNWSVETIDSTVGAGIWSTVSVDSNGNPYVVYTLTSGTVMYGYRDGSGWHTESLGAGVNPDLEVDPATGTPYVSLRQGTNLIVMRRDGGAWQSWTVGTNVDTVGWADLSLCYTGTGPASMVGVAWHGGSIFHRLSYASASLIPEPTTVILIACAGFAFVGGLIRRKIR